MRVDVLTLFPGMFQGPMTESMMWKARDRALLDLYIHDIRAAATDRHRTADDTPYGGGGGMVMRVDVVVGAIEALLRPRTRIVLTTPQGRLFSHTLAKEFAAEDHLLIICGHYEGIDDRVRQLIVTDEVSIGDYVLTGGELPAMVIIDALARHIPGVLGAEGGADIESHADGVLEGPHYTRPQTFRGLGVPPVLQEGDHARIKRWRREQGLRRTWENRPDLLRQARLTEDEQYLLAAFADEYIRR